MTAPVLLFDGYVPGDAALENSHWVAERTRERLGEEAVMLTFPEAVRAKMMLHLGGNELRGLAVFGHGDAGYLHTAHRIQHQEPADRRRILDETSEAGAVYGCDHEPALDIDNVHLLKGRWCHALACCVGLSLADRAIAAGAAVFVAYQTSLTPEYDAGSLPSGLRSRVAALVTMTTTNLHAGVHEEIALRARVQETIEELESWLCGDEGAAWVEEQGGYMEIAGILAFAQQLRRDMVVRTAES